MVRQQIYALIEQERARQNEKWGEQNHQPPLWVAILGEEFGEVCENSSTVNPDWSDYKKELIQVAAVAVQMIECIERGNTFRENTV